MPKPNNVSIVREFTIWNWRTALNRSAATEFDMTYLPTNLYHGMVVSKRLDSFERELRGADPVPDCPVTVAVFVVAMIPVVLAIIVMLMSQ